MKDKRWCFVLVVLMVLASLSLFAQTKKLRDIGRYKFIPIDPGTPAPAMMATMAPRSSGDLEAIRSLPPAVVRKRGEELLALIASAMESAGARGIEANGRRPKPQENALVSRLQQMVRDEAAALGVSPEVLATRRDVEALVFEDRGESAVLHGWRRAVIGEKLLAAK